MDIFPKVNLKITNFQTKFFTCGFKEIYDRRNIRCVCNIFLFETNIYKVGSWLQGNK